MKRIRSDKTNNSSLCLSNSQQHELISGTNDLYTQDGQFVCVHLPAMTNVSIKKSHLLIVVHGYGARKNNSRGRQVVRRVATYWGQQVAAQNWVVMAPHFDEKRFNNDYQRLNRSGLRADLRLNRLIEITGELIPHLDANKSLLLGFSGGGQFVHRYLAFHGHLILRAVIGAPGWFMWPNPWLPYPLGMGEPDAPNKARERLRRLCRQKMLLLVGDKDIDQGAYRKTYYQMDLCTLQGEGRRERAANWFTTLKQAAIDENIKFRSHMRILKNTSHRVNQVFAKTAVAFLAGSDDT